jgi:ferredoxin-NADP reductase
VPAKEFVCKVLEITWLTPTVIGVRFEPSKRFRFDPGQFVSVVVPDPKGGKRPLRRAYSLAVAPEEGYGLSIKVVQDGPGSHYMASLKPGDTFKAFAPYGDFVFDHESGREACFISTGTGVAPFLSMIQSKAYRDNPPPKATNVFGARTEDEIIYPGLFEKLGLVEVNAISQPGPAYAGFKGRVTDYLKALPADWGWDITDFYICGNGDMVAEVRRLLRSRGVQESRIHQEVYFVAPDRLRKPAAQPAGSVAQLHGKQQSQQPAEAASEGVQGSVDKKKAATPPPFKHAHLIKKAS